MREPVEDQFPLIPFYPLGRPIDGRQVNFPVESGDVWIRDKGTSLRQFDLKGTCPSLDAASLLDFYESHKVDGCTFADRSFDPPVFYIVKFLDAPQLEESGFEVWAWSVSLKQVADVA